jgi:hypothetical protein
MRLDCKAALSDNKTLSGISVWEAARLERENPPRLPLFSCAETIPTVTIQKITIIYKVHFMACKYITKGYFHERKEGKTGLMHLNLFSFIDYICLDCPNVSMKLPNASM